MVDAPPPTQRLLGPLAVLVVLPVLLAAWTPVLPRLDFDVDPRVAGADVRVTLGAAGVGWLALWGTAAAWAGVAASVAAGARLRWKSTLLVMAGAAAAAWHLPGSFEDAHLGVSWVWAASAGLAAAHLGRHPEARRWLLALPVALLPALLLQAGFYRWVTHPLTVETYEAAVAAGSWAGPGSNDPAGAAARLYERRLRIDDATGPFGFANVLGTVAAGLAVAALTTLPRPRGAGWGAGALAAAAGLVVVLLTRSAGAAAALAAGVLTFAAAWAAAGRAPGRLRRVALPALALGLVAGVVAVVLVRGWIGAPPPEAGATGERTLLFRSQYWAGAARLWLDGAAWLGLGPGGFGPAYTQVKAALAPETVTSTHNAFLDFAVMLGLGGLAWAAALGGWLFCAARGGAAAEEEAVGPADRPELYGLAGLAVVLFGFEAMVRLAELGPLDLLWRAVAGAAFVGVALAARRAGPRGTGFATLGAATAVLVHGQLDLGFHHATGAPLLWLLVGLAAGVAGEAATREHRRLLAAAPLLAGVLAVAVVGTGLSRLTGHADALARAAGAVRAGDARGTLDALAEAGAAVGEDPVAERWQATVLFELAAAQEAAGRDREAIAAYAQVAGRVPGQDAAVGEAAARSAEILARTGAAPEAVAAARADAVGAFERSVAASPTRPERWIRLGEAQAAAGDRPGAAAAFVEALRLDGLLYLDPDAQLRDDQRARVEAQRAALNAPAAGR